MYQAIKSGPRPEKIETTGFRDLGEPLQIQWQASPFAGLLLYNFNGSSPLVPQRKPLLFMCLCIPSLKQSHAFQDFSIVQDNKEVYQVSNHLSNWPAGWGGGWTVARLRGVRAGWMGRIPGFGWVCPALGLWRGAMEVSVVGMGSVSLEKKKKKTKIHVKVWGGADRVHDGLISFPLHAHPNFPDLLNRHFPEDVMCY